MSFFILRTGEQRDAPPGSAAFAGAMFRATALALPGIDLSLYVGPGHAAPAVHQAPNGDTIAALGSLLIDGASADRALRGLLERFDSEDFTWQGLLGTHILIVYKNATLYVLGDGLGANKIYRNSEGTLWSNSFLALCELGDPAHLDPQACYEYVTNGSVFGTRTPIQGFTSLPANSILTVKGERTDILRRPSPIADEPLDHLTTLDAVADFHVRQLEQVFEPLARNYGDRLRISFSGGFDSRLMLANLLKFDVRPSLFVYGDEGDEDVRIARLICRAEGLGLEVIDKGQVPPPDPDAFAEETEKNLLAFDAWKVEAPLFDYGADREDRLSRHVDGRVPLNGSLGEIYRNFFYMPDRPSSTSAVVSTFYSRYDPRAFTARFDEASYRAAMAAAMRDAIGSDSDGLERAQVEQIYPNFRGRFWTGRDAQINQRFGDMFFPYLEHAAISNTSRVPIRFKDLGRLQGRMIRRINPRLAAYPSDYGFALDGPRPLRYRVKSLLGTQRPAALRRLSFRLTHRERQPRDGALAPEYLGRVIDLEFPVMRTLFNVGAVNSAAQYGLIATLEYLAARYGMSVADD